MLGRARVPCLLESRREGWGACAISVTRQVSRNADVLVLCVIVTLSSEASAIPDRWEEERWGRGKAGV